VDVTLFAVIVPAMTSIRAFRNYRSSQMNYFRFAVAGLVAILAAAGTYASLAPEGFGLLAAIPAVFIAMVVAVPLTPRLS